MAKIIFKKKPSEIHVDNVKKHHVIDVRDKGKSIGIIMYNENKWRTRLFEKEEYSDIELSDAFKNYYESIEFHVLNPES